MFHCAGAIGDLDGDGSPDLVTITTLTGQVVDKGYSFDHMVYKTVIHKINLQNSLDDKNNNIPIASIHNFNETKDSNSNVKFSPFFKQRWMQYMGTDGHNIYIEPYK